MSERVSSPANGGSVNKVSREAQREEKVQDAIDLVKALMAEDAEGNEEPAKKALFRAHRLAKEARHWGEIAKCWFHYFLELDLTKSCFLKALDIASTGATVPTVEYLIKEVDEEGTVVRHLIGHRMVPTGVYLHSLFAATNCLSDQTEEQLRLMAKAEEEAEKVRSSLRSFEQFDEEALRYFDKAESQLGWLHIAKCWVVDFDDRQQAIRCIGRAEKLASEMAATTNWVEVAKVWSRVMGDPSEARRCVAEAESLLERHTAHEYIMLAEGLAALGDLQLPVEYLDKAETLIDELSDWSAIAYTWEELGYFDRAERANNIWEYLASKVSEEEYMANGGGYGRYAAGEGPY